MSETRAIYRAGQEPKTYSDFIFWERSSNRVLDIDSMPTTDGPTRAQKLAQKYGVTVAYAIVQEYFVEPQKCPECGLVLPESGPCWHNLFEVEAPDNIPFRGEAFPARIITEADEYF